MLTLSMEWSQLVLSLCVPSITVDFAVTCLYINGLHVLRPSVLPALFKENLKGEAATEGGTASLSCELTKVSPVEWMKGQQSLKASDKYKMRQEGCVVKLVIHDVELKDAAEYTCICGDQKTATSLTVHGKEYSIEGHPLSAPACDWI